MKRLLTTLLASLSVFFLLTQPVCAENQERKGKSGFKGDESGIGGPTSVGEQLREDDELKEPAFRFPGFDRFFSPWFDWKRGISEKYGLEIGLDYSALYQGASDVLPDAEDQAASGVVRLFGRWTLFGRGTKNPGTLVFKVENRHRLGTDIPPSQLGFEAGYAGITGTLFNDAGSFVGDLNWQQVFHGGRGGFIVGRYDPSDFMDITGHANPWATFSNLSVSLNTSIALPDFSFGATLGHLIGDKFWVNVGANDANGVIDEVEFFEGGAEFFTFLEAGWTPSRAQRYFNQVHVTLWHVDKREDAGVPESEGIALGANWTFDEKWMVFARAGWSDGAAPLMNATATAGVMRRVHRRDLLGLGTNWGNPSDDDLRDQWSTELFYRFQFSQNLALTPSVQWLVDPALNPGEDHIWIVGFRARLTL